MSKYSIGIDFGTLSGRAILVDVNSGEELATSTLEYKHGVMEHSLPSGKKIPSRLGITASARLLRCIFDDYTKGYRRSKRFP